MKPRRGDLPHRRGAFRFEHDSAVRRGIRAAAAPLPFLVLPFLVLYWLVPFLSTMTIGVDYAQFSINHQLILQFSLRNGTTPLFVPGFALGQPVGAATLGQLFHPISHLSAILPGYWSGGALEDYTALGLLSLGVTAWLLFLTFRELGVGLVPSVLASFLSVFNLRMLDFFRYGASLQNYVGFLLTSAALLHLAAFGRSYRGTALLIVATSLLLCGGHPQVAYLSMLGAIVVAALGPLFVTDLRRGDPARARGSWTGSTAFALAGLAGGILLSAAYLLPFAVDFAADNAARGQNEFWWTYTPFGTASPTSLLHSIFKPLRSDVHGSFAGSALFAVPLLAPVLRIFRPLPRSVWALWSTVIVVLCLALAEQLPLYYVLWKILPGFSSFRVPGRVTMIIPFLLALLLTWLMQTERISIRVGRRSWDVTPATLLGVVAAVLYTLYGLVPWPDEAKELAPPILINGYAAGAAPAVFVAGIASLLLFALYGSRPGAILGLVMLVVVVGQQVLVLRSSTWVVEKRPAATYQEIAGAQRRRLGFSGDPGAGMENAAITTWRKTLHGRAMPPPLASLHWSYRGTASQAESLEWLSRRTDAATLAVEDPALLPRAAAPRPDRRGTLALVRATFNELRFDVDTLAPALLRVGYPYSKRWTAFIDGREEAPMRVDGAWLGVSVPRGRSTVDLRYVSTAALWGMIISCLTAWSVGCAWAVGLRRTSTRLGAITSISIAVLCFFAVWQRSLYGGRHLGTEYAWSNDAGAKAR